MLCSSIPPRIYESLKTLCCLAQANGPLQAHEIARATGLPPAQTAKILQLMTWAGFVKSRRGRGGGFWLVVPARRIRVTDVVEFFATHPETGHRQDAIEEALAEATARCQREFKRVTLADIAKLAAAHDHEQSPERPSCRTLRQSRSAATARR